MKKEIESFGRGPQVVTTFKKVRGAMYPTYKFQNGVLQKLAEEHEHTNCGYLLESVILVLSDLPSSV